MRGINAQPRFLIIPHDSTKIPLTKNFRNPDCLKTIIFGIRDIKRKTDDERKSCWSCPLWIIVLSHRVLETAWKNITGLGGWKFLSLTKTNVAYLRRWQPISVGLLEDKQVATMPYLFSAVYLKFEFIFAPKGNTFSSMPELAWGQVRLAVYLAYPALFLTTSSSNIWVETVGRENFWNSLMFEPVIFSFVKLLVSP